MTAVIQNNLSPQAVALIAAKLQVCYCSPGPNEAMVEAEQQCQWFTGLLIRMLGNDQFQSLCDELGF